MDFQASITEAGKAFLKQNYTRVLLVGDYDTDGICAVSVLKQACARAGIETTELFIQQLDHASLDLLGEHEADAVVFADLGAGALDLLGQLSKPVYVLDHHPIQGEAAVTHLNPVLFEQDSRSITSSGIAYWFSLGMDTENKNLAATAFLGVLGDTQERNGLSDLNKLLLQHAVVQGSIKQSERLRLFGLNTRPLIKVLTYSSDLQIPGVTNNYHGAKKFLQSLDIRWSIDGKARKYVDLSEEEQADLHDAIVNRKPNASDDELYVTTYAWQVMPEHLQDMKELATIINACGRLGEYQLALHALEGQEQENLAQVLTRYKQILQSTFQNLQEMQHDNETCYEGSTYVLFDLDDELPPSMAGIIASMLARNQKYPKGTIIAVLTKFPGGREKLSLRVSRDVETTALNELLAQTFPEETISTGGHANAAGAVFFEEMHDEFIQRLIAALE